MKEVLLITGPCGVGKTTTAKAWAKLKQGAIIECDYLTEWIYKKDFPQWDEREEAFTAKLSAIMAKEYLQHGMSVAIENVWTPKGIAIIRHELKEVDLKITAVRLKCALPENHRRDRTRVEENQMRERVDIVNAELDGYSWPDSVKLINSTDLTLEEVLLEIEN